jgi:hypothetical protein
VSTKTVATKTCDRCGKEVVIPAEGMPGWKHVLLPTGEDLPDYKDLCPECVRSLIAWVNDE